MTTQEKWRRVSLKQGIKPFEKFKEWKLKVEKNTATNMKHFRTNNGLEFLRGSLFNHFCVENGITRHRLTPYTPQQNGVTERMSKTILEKMHVVIGPVSIIP